MASIVSGANESSDDDSDAEFETVFDRSNVGSALTEQERQRSSSLGTWGSSLFRKSRRRSSGRSASESCVEEDKCDAIKISADLDIEREQTTEKEGIVDKFRKWRKNGKEDEANVNLVQDNRDKSSNSVSKYSPLLVKKIDSAPMPIPRRGVWGAYRSSKPDGIGATHNSPPPLNTTSCVPLTPPSMNETPGTPPGYASGWRARMAMALSKSPLANSASPGAGEYGTLEVPMEADNVDKPVSKWGLSLRDKLSSSPSLGRRTQADAGKLDSESLDAERSRFLVRGFGEGVLVHTDQGIRSSSVCCYGISSISKGSEQQEDECFDIVVDSRSQIMNLLEVAELQHIAGEHDLWVLNASIANIEEDDNSDVDEIVCPSHGLHTDIAEIESCEDRVGALLTYDPDEALDSLENLMDTPPSDLLSAWRAFAKRKRNHVKSETLNEWPAQDEEIPLNESRNDEHTPVSDHGDAGSSLTNDATQTKWFHFKSRNRTQSKSETIDELGAATFSMEDASDQKLCEDDTSSPTADHVTSSRWFAIKKWNRTGSDTNKEPGSTTSSSRKCLTDESIPVEWIQDDDDDGIELY